MGELSAGLHGVVDQLRPSQEEQERQKEAFQQVRSTLLREWPEAQVHLFGSTANCLSICNNNDIDVCLELPEGVPDQVGFALLAGGMVCEEMSLACCTVTDKQICFARCAWRYCVMSTLACMPAYTSPCWCNTAPEVPRSITMPRCLSSHHVVASKANLASWKYGECGGHLGCVVQSSVLCYSCSSDMMPS